MSLDVRSRSYDVMGGYNLAQAAADGTTGNPGAPTAAATLAAPKGGEVIDANAATKQQIQSTFKEQFGEYAADPQKFHSLMREVYGDSYDVGKTEQFRQSALRG